MPTTATLTQRRSGSSSTSAKSRETKSKNTGPEVSLSSMSENTQEDGSVLKIIVWGVLILATGIGLALLVRNLTDSGTSNDEKQEETTQEEETEEELAEVEPEEETPTEEVTEEEQPEEEVTTPEETEEEVEEEEIDTPITGTGLTNEYSTSPQTLGEGLTSAVVTIGGYTYSTYAPNFVYGIKLANSDKFPNVSATLDETNKTLTVIVDNISRDNIVGNGGTGSTDFAAARNVTKVDISNSGTKTTFVFTMTKATQYKIVAVDGDPDMIQVDIKNN